MNILSYDLYFFDCDGVILDSNSIKTNAFQKTLKNLNSDNIDTFLEFHLKNNGISRIEKFRYYLNNISHLHDISSLNLFLNEFHKIVLRDLYSCSFINGFLEFILFLKKNKKKCFVISAGSDKELELVFKKKNIIKYFEGIYGSSCTKQKHIRSILNLYGNQNGVFFGDSKNDYIVSKTMMLDFIFIFGKSNWVDFKKYNLDRIFKDFDHINYLKRY